MDDNNIITLHGAPIVPAPDLSPAAIACEAVYSAAKQSLLAERKLRPLLDRYGSCNELPLEDAEQHRNKALERVRDIPDEDPGEFRDLVSSISGGHVWQQANPELMRQLGTADVRQSR